MLERRVLYAVFIAVLGISYIWTGNILLIFSAGFLVILFALELMMLRLTARNVSISYESDTLYPEDAPVKDCIRVDFQGVNFLNSLRIEMEYENLFTGMKEERICYLPLNHENGIVALPEGRFPIGNTHVRLKDAHGYGIMGLWKSPVSHDEGGTFLVYPRDYGIHTMIVNTPYANIQDAQNSQNRRGSDVTSIFEMRDYQPGDPVRSIHFKMSEKLDRLIVKEFAAPAKYQTLIVTDLNRVYDKMELSSERIGSVIATAKALSTDLIHKGFGHHMAVLFNGQLFMDEVENENQLLNFMIKVLGMQVTENVPLPEALLRLQLWRDYTKIICVTGFLYGSGIDALARQSEVTMLLPTEAETGTIETGDHYQIVTVPETLLKAHRCRVEI